METIVAEERPAVAAPPAYDPVEIEPRWQRRWEEEGLDGTPEPGPERPKWYALTMFPYTSGDLHVGHWYAMAPSDALARFRRMQGYSVLYPMGFDSFGLNGENAAIKRGIHPAEWTRANVERMRGQLKAMGAMYDWSREVLTCDPSYYRWTQWLFTRFYRHGLAYRAEAPANWCPSCKTVLANEQVIDGLCERCDTPVERRERRQWLLAITRYADRMLDFGAVEWPAEVQARQRAWIGRSEGARIRFPVAGPGGAIEVFTTRPDTLFGATFIVLAPEHPLVDAIATAGQRAAVERYREETRRYSDVERQQGEREVGGVFTGAWARHPATGEELPVWISDYVLPHYGGGAIMAVPAHDRRDHRFAVRFNLPIRRVVDGGHGGDAVFAGDGPLVGSGRFDGLSGEAARQAITAHLEQSGAGGRAVSYRLRDWLVSRQRYWGAPIPIVYCDGCGEQPVPDEDLPVRLPDTVDFRPGGESPLASVPEFVNTACPQCGGPARRETDTLDALFDSAWYFLRYLSPGYAGGPFDPREGARWLPVDQYGGGVDHATAHLIYVRFFSLALFDMGITPIAESIRRLHANGMITVGNRKMSKSRGPVIVPEKYVKEFGADAFRAYLMFIGPWKDGGEWDDSGLVGVRRWLSRVWRTVLSPRQGAGAVSPGELRRAAAEAVRAATADLEQYKVNTYIAALMEFSNTLARAAAGPEWEAARDTLLLLMAPATPHIAEELWQRTGHHGSIHARQWPAAVERQEEVTVAVQVAGKLRGRVTVPAAATAGEAEAAARALPRVAAHLEGRPARVIYAPGRLINFLIMTAEDA